LIKASPEKVQQDIQDKWARVCKNKPYPINTDPEQVEPPQGDDPGANGGPGDESKREQIQKDPPQPSSNAGTKTEGELSKLRMWYNSLDPKKRGHVKRTIGMDSLQFVNYEQAKEFEDAWMTMYGDDPEQF
jgi:hypothetical protein